MTAIIEGGASRVAGLDMLRGVAAIGVVLFHLSWAAHLLDDSVPTFAVGALGVQMFFVISGYVILMTAYRSPSRGAFVRARAIRLYPAFLVCLGLTTTWALALHLSYYELSPSAWLLNLTMVPGWFGARAADGVYWTLRYEIGFYALVALLLPWVKRGLALRLGAIFLLALPWLPELRLGAFFVMGIAIYEWRGNRLFAGAVLIAAVIIGRDVDLTISAPLLVAIAGKVPVPRAAAAWAGAISYPLYLLHDHIGCVLVMLYRGLGLWAALVLALISVVLLAAFVSHFLERPAIAFLKRKYKETGRYLNPGRMFLRNETNKPRTGSGIPDLS